MALNSASAVHRATTPCFLLLQQTKLPHQFGEGIMRDGLYYLKHEELDSALAVVLSRTPIEELLLQHRRLGHMSMSAVRVLYPTLFNATEKEKLVCDACEYGKHTRSSYIPCGVRSKKLFHTIHSDVWGPCSTTSVHGYRWFVTFIDCSSRYTWLYVMHNKNNVFSCFNDFHKIMMNQYGAQIKVFRFDNGTKYVNYQFEEYFGSYGIVHRTTCANSPEQNGVAKRKNRHLLEVTRCLMLQMNVPKFFWSDAVITATYPINRMPLRTLDFKSPLECLTGEMSYIVPPRCLDVCVSCMITDHQWEN
jgi:transposase InsO family protein